MPRHPLFYLGADHAGFALKEALKPLLEAHKIKIEDLSPDLDPNDDYPLIGIKLAKQVIKTKDAQGILICGTGLGIAMAANRVRGIRAAVIHDPAEAMAARAHNHANVLVFGGRVLSPKKLPAILEAWLATKPDRSARHVRRIHQLDVL